MDIVCPTISRGGVIIRNVEYTYTCIQYASMLYETSNRYPVRASSAPAIAAALDQMLLVMVLSSLTTNVKKQFEKSVWSNLASYFQFRNSHVNEDAYEQMGLSATIAWNL